MSSPQVGPKMYAMAMFVVVSVLAGLLVAGLAVPVAAIGGSSAKYVADGMDSLPADLDIKPASDKTLVLMANGTPLAELYDENRVVVPMEQIAPIMRVAQLAIEDHRFYEHGALDIKGTLRALVRTGSGTTVQGGSTLTQQYVKQVRVEAAQAAGDQTGVFEAQEQTLARKVMELRYAIALEAKYSKDEILTRYLNIAYYGDGAYGVEAAARHYFNVAAKDLTLVQAAMIAGLLQNPTNDPVTKPQVAIDRRNVVLNRMAELQDDPVWAAQFGLMYTAADLAAAKATGFDASKVVTSRKGCVGTKYPFMCDYVVQSLLANPALGKTKDERRNVVYRGGLVIKTQIDDPSMQVAQTAVSSKVAAIDPVISTMVMIEPGTGLIKAMAQNRSVMGTNADVGETFYNYAVEKSMGGAEGYQAGSTFKAFTLATALSQGIPVNKKLPGSTPMQFKGKTFRTCDADGKAVSFKFPTDYNLKNSTGNYGEIDMRKGAAMSVNTFFVGLEQLAGICQTARMADLLGAKLSNGDSMEKTYAWIPSFTLGVAEVTPISMAVAYATLAARGVRCDPIIVSAITSRSGQAVATQSANCKQVIPPEVADGVSYVLEYVMAPGGTGNRVRLRDGRPQAGKTGTIDSNAAVWFAGYTPNLAGVAMISIDKSPRYTEYWRSKGGSLKGVTLSTGLYLEGSGSGDAGDIWTPAMTKATAALPKTDFVNPTDAIINGQKAAIPSTAGMSAANAQATLEGAGFSVLKKNVYDVKPVGSYIGATCDGLVGGTCYLMYSQGPRPPDAPTSGPT
ncbi:MAG: transglycosylase domain-containing protein [Propionibacteriaceae bacterium]